MKMYIRLVLFIVSLTITQISLAQKKQGQALIDSLVKELPKKLSDTTKVNLLKEMSNAYANVNTDEGIKYGNEGLALAESIAWKKGIGRLNSAVGINYLLKKDFAKAVEYFNKAIAIAKEIGDKITLADTYHRMGYIRDKQYEYASALDYLSQSLAINEELGYKTGQAKNFYVMGGIYSNQSEYTKALEYYGKSLKIQEQLSDRQTLANLLSNMGLVYHNQSNYPKALAYHLNSLKISEELGNKQQMAGSFNNIGNIYSNRNEHNIALAYFLKALKINEETGNKNWQAINLNNIGIVHFGKKDFVKALEYFSKALTINEATGNQTNKCTNFMNIGNAHFEQAHYFEALEYHTKSLNLGREIQNQNYEAGSLGAIGLNYLSIARDSTGMALMTLFKGDKIACLERAKAYTDSAIVIQKEIEDLHDLFGSYFQLSDIHALLGEPKDALLSYMNYALFKDSVFNEEKDKKITQTVLTYEFAKRQDSLKLINEKRELGFQKEIALKALSYEYEKKRQAAKTEEEKQKLLYEEKLKQQEIENTYAQKIAAAEALQKERELEGEKKELEQKQKDELSKAEQEKKDISHRNIRNSILVGLGGALIFLGVVYRQRNHLVKEKHRSDELLLNILPAETAEELKATGAAQAQHFAEVTVLFTDFKNFTAMSENLSAQAVVNEINYYYSAFDNIISKHNIEKIKTIGDAYMCAGGLPAQSKTHAEDTVSAALEIRDFMLAERQKRQAQGKPFLEIRIGCNTGPVIAGIVGIKKFAYDIWGDTVNTAARMESSGEVGKVNISGSTYEKIKDTFTCTYRGKIDAKNKGEIDMYFVEV